MAAKKNTVGSAGARAAKPAAKPAAKKGASKAKKATTAKTAKAAPATKKPAAKKPAAKKAAAKKRGPLARLTSGVGNWLRKITGKTKKPKGKKSKPAATAVITTSEIIGARDVGEPPPAPGST